MSAAPALKSAPLPLSPVEAELAAGLSAGLTMSLLFALEWMTEGSVKMLAQAIREGARPKRTVGVIMRRGRYFAVVGFRGDPRRCLQLPLDLKPRAIR
ncbi:MAG: hypothetical protein ACXW3D_01275 [Caulobacteraceae bacterium]